MLDVAQEGNVGRAVQVLLSPATLGSADHGNHLASILCRTQKHWDRFLQKEVQGGGWIQGLGHSCWDQSSPKAFIQVHTSIQKQQAAHGDLVGHLLQVEASALATSTGACCWLGNFPEQNTSSWEDPKHGPFSAGVHGVMGMHLRPWCREVLHGGSSPTPALSTCKVSVSVPGHWRPSGSAVGRLPDLPAVGGF